MVNVRQKMIEPGEPGQALQTQEDGSVEWSEQVPSAVGDGSDGKVTFDGTTTVLGLTPSSNTYTLDRSIFLDDGSKVNSGVTIVTNGFHIFCNGTLTVDGVIHNDGTDGTEGDGFSTPGTGGAGGASNIYGGGGAGGDGNDPGGGA